MPMLGASDCYALTLRVGFQNGLLSPLLGGLYTRLQQIPGATVLAVLRHVGSAAHEIKLLLRVPNYPVQSARNLLVAWAESSIDRLNDAHPYLVPSLLNQSPAKPNYDHETLVRCASVDTAGWLREHADGPVALALLALTQHLHPLLECEIAQLKTALPVAIAAAFGNHYPRRPSVLAAAVFANTANKRQIAHMLKNWQVLETQSLVIRQANLPSATTLLFVRLVTALRDGIASVDASVDRFSVIRLLLNQLGFAGSESDYLILLSLPPRAALVLHQRLGDFHGV